jgi:CheY-like chemotaxis protein
MQRQRLRILIVEDNADSAEVLRLLLEYSGHSVSTASCGESALQQARRSVPDIVICDIGLPGAMDGCEVARHFRNDAILKGSHLVALSGYGEAGDVMRSRAAGFDQHFVKPVDPVALEKYIASISGLAVGG